MHPLIQEEKREGESRGSSKYKTKLGERPTILDSHSDKVLKNFIDQSETKNVQKSLFRYFGVQHHQQGRDWEKSSLVHYSNTKQMVGVVQGSTEPGMQGANCGKEKAN